jgi:hypothetical protein
MSEKGIDPDVVSYTAVISGLIRAKQFNKAVQNKMKSNVAINDQKRCKTRC